MDAILILLLIGIVIFCIMKALEPNTSLTDFIKDLLGLHKTPAAQPDPSGLPAQNRYGLYQVYGTDYDSFATIVWACVNSLHRKFNLSCPANISGIYAAEIADRVKLNNGRIIFYYEISLSEILYEGGMKRVTSPLDTQDLADALSRNLPSYLRGGYYFSGAVYVWDIGNNTYRIEIEGVARQYHTYTGDIIL